MHRDGAIAPATGASVNAATVLLLRDGERGVEVLLAERPQHARSFAGAWVFPGGVVEDEDLVRADPASEATLRRTGARETSEEVGLNVDPAELVPFAVWRPPAGAPKPVDTMFFAVRVPDGELRPQPDEVVAVAWVRPRDALDRHATGAMTLWPPTWVTLHDLDGQESVDAILAGFAARGIRSYVSRLSGDRRAVIWQEDAEYAVSDPRSAPQLASPAVAARHRLIMERLPWVYLNDF